MAKIMGIIAVGLCILAGQASSSQTWYVAPPPLGDDSNPGTQQQPFATIQKGIDSASHGHTVIVAQGTYYENIHFNGKNIILTSTDPLNPDVVAKTIIDGNQSGSVVTFSGTENETCLLSGFTIRNGLAYHGGGICGGTWEAQGRATIQNNAIAGNSSGWYGGGLAYCAGTIQNNTITGNSAPSGGGGLFGCGGTIRNNTITENSAEQGGGLCSCHGTVYNNTISANWADWYGGGLCGCGATVRNNTVTGNSAGSWGAGLAFCTGAIQNNTITANSAGTHGGGLHKCELTAIRNCIIWANSAPQGPQVYGSARATYSCIQDWTEGGEGNITDDPLFLDPDGPDNDPATYEDNDYHLAPESPCIDAGKNDDWMWDALDIDGEPRIDWVAGTVDIGADEFHWHIGAQPLGLDQPTTDLIVRGGRHAYKVAALAKKNLVITVKETPPEAIIRLYASYAAESGRLTYDYRSDQYTATPFLVIPDTLEGDYYILLYAPDVPEARASYTITAQCVDLWLGSVSPAQAGNAGHVTLTISGVGLDKISQLTLVGPSSQTIAPIEIVIETSTRLFATFDLREAEPGLYDILAEDVEGNTAALADGLELVAARGLELWLEIKGPDQIRPNRAYTYRLRYGNSGDTDAYGVSIFVELTEGVEYKVEGLDEWHRFEAGQVLHFVSTVVGARSDSAAPLTIRAPSGELTTIRADITRDVAQYLRLHSRTAGGEPTGDQRLGKEVGVETLLEPPMVPSAEVDTYPPATEPWEPGPPGYINLFEIYHPDHGSWYESAVSLGGESLAWSFPYAEGPWVRITDFSSLQSGAVDGWQVRHIGSWRPRPGWGGGRTWSEVEAYVRSRVTPHENACFHEGSGGGCLSCIDFAMRVLFGDDWIDIVPDLNADGRWDTYEAMSFIWELNGIGAERQWWAIGDERGAIRARRYKDISILRSWDPNEKKGPALSGEQRVVAAGEHFDYVVYFENVPAATAPAQEVFISDYLDPALGLTTFRPTEIAFGDQIIALPDDSQDSYTRLTIPDYREEVEKDWWVDITVELDYPPRLAKWTFRTLDPETGDLPTDDLAGFLPQNDDTGRGEGHVASTIRPKPDTAAGTVITNSASIVFDVAPPVITNAVWNTIGYPYHPCDDDQDLIIGDWELLHAIAAWAKYERRNGWPKNLDDYDWALLELIDLWAKGTEYDPEEIVYGDP